MLITYLATRDTNLCVRGVQFVLHDLSLLLVPTRLVGRIIGGLTHAEMGLWESCGTGE